MEVSDESGAVRGWLVGPDIEFVVEPQVGDLLVLPADRAAESLQSVLRTTHVLVLRRHLRPGGGGLNAPAVRVIAGAAAGMQLESIRQRHEWLEYSPTALECAYGGCARDAKREADSALWSCTTSGHDLCLECDRPVRGSGLICAYHDPFEVYDGSGDHDIWSEED